MKASILGMNQIDKSPPMEYSDFFKIRTFKGCQPYILVWEKMQQFTDTRTTNDHDELWLLEHYPVFTQGKTGKKEHIINAGDIPVVQTDRGGQVTYHGPGQLIAYILFDIRRKGVGVRSIVTCLEQAVIRTLQSYKIISYAKRDAPGVYVNQSKIASLGLRIRRGCTFHGLAFNIDMDLKPFLRINPCGYRGLQITQLKDHYPKTNISQVSSRLVYHIKNEFLSL